MIFIILIVLLSILSAFFYYKGGEGPLEIRRFGVPFVGIISLLIATHFVISTKILIALLICYGLNYVAMTTYCKFKKKQEDVYWYNWLMTGALYGIAYVPYSIVSGHWLSLLYRTAALVVIICVWSEVFGKVEIEAGGRGFFHNLTILFYTLK